MLRGDDLRGKKISKKCPNCEGETRTVERRMSPDGVGYIFQMLYCYGCTGLYTTCYHSETLELVPANQVFAYLDQRDAP